MSATDLSAVAPALILAVGAAVLAIPARPGAAARAWLGVAAAMAAAVTAIAIGAGASGFAGTVARDGAGVFFVALIGMCAAATLALAASDRGRSTDDAALVLFSACGAVIVVSAADLVVLFVGLALLTLPIYGLTRRRDRDPSRHLVLGATSSAVALYGIALLFAATGETTYAGLGRATHNPLYLAGLALALAGIGGHIVLALAHRWSVVVNVAIVGALLRLSGVTRSGEAALDWLVSLAMLAAIALVVATFAALTERRLRRLVGYATLAQLGYVAIAAAASGTAAAAFALAAYAAVAIGLFAVLAAVRRDEPVLADLAGLARQRPLLALALGMTVLGIVGIPPAVSFLAKVYVFESAVRGQLLWLVILGGLATAVSAASYVRLAFACFAPPPLDAIAHPRARVATAVALSAAVVTVLAGVIPGPLLDAAQAVRF